jgi:predicted aldo/keto reductase-like oxidoreductase
MLPIDVSHISKHRSPVVFKKLFIKWNFAYCRGQIYWADDDNNLPAEVSTQ